MNTAITDQTAYATAGWIFYDAECRFCVGGRQRWGKVFERRGYVWLPLQTAGAAARLGVTQDQLMAEMWVLATDGCSLNGVNAWIKLMRGVWWLSPLAFLLALPGIKSVGQMIYRWIARSRYCIAGRCEVRPVRQQGLRPIDCLLLVVVIISVSALGWRWPAWVLMWALAFALGQIAKWLTLRDAREAGINTPVELNVGWFFLWPGLDGRAFFGQSAKVSIPVVGEWLAAAIKLALGITLIWVVAPAASQPLMTGWLAMIGIVLCLHFGCFHLLSLAWRAGGVNAQPIMKGPLAATSLAEFWGERWNTAFSIPARRLLFTLLARRHGVAVASWAVFLASGLMHELVISLPARGGYGLPTTYFGLQGTAIMFERSKCGRALGLGRGWRGWLFMLVVTAAPAFWLFHPPFIRNVILPMLHAIGAT